VCGIFLSPNVDRSHLLRIALDGLQLRDEETENCQQTSNVPEDSRLTYILGFGFLRVYTVYQQGAGMKSISWAIVDKLIAQSRLIVKLYGGF